LDKLLHDDAAFERWWSGPPGVECELAEAQESLPELPDRLEAVLRRRVIRARVLDHERPFDEFDDMSLVLELKDRIKGI
jgi:hypothetical protein